MSALGCGGNPCPDNVACEACGEPAYCLNDPPGWHPCLHDRALCGRPDCLAECVDCRTELWAEAVRTGVYDAIADPLTTTPVESAVDYEARTRLPGFDTTTNSYRRKA